MKNLVFIFIFFYTSITISAQLGLSVGGGVNFSNLKVKNLDSFKPSTKTNYFLSVKPEFHLSDKMCLALDIQFSQKGFGLDADTTDFIDGYKFQYLDLIPQVQYKFAEQVAIFGGLGVGIRGSEKYKIKGAWEEAVTKVSGGTDFTFVLGARIFASEKLSIFAQYAGSMSSFFDFELTDSQGNMIENVDSRLRNFQLGIGYQLF
jgi:Outer membrane protein beta-barrel domain